MVTILITSFLLLAVISYIIYRRQQSSSGESAEHDLPPPPRFGGLFSDVEPADAPARLTDGEAATKSAEQRAALLTRAGQGDKEALKDARATDDATLYGEVLDALVERADSEKSLLGLASYIARGDGLRVNAKLAEKFIEAWKATPDRRSTAKMLHIAALADDASTYQTAVETAFQCWRRGLLPDMSAEELRTLIDSEYWILAQDVRSSGAGFVLKSRLAGIRRELQQAARPVR